MTTIKGVYREYEEMFPGGYKEVKGQCWPPLETSDDPVNHPTHYTQGNVECIEAIRSALTPEQYRGYLKGQIFKYVWREGSKGGLESLKKGQWYLDQLIKFDEGLL